MASSSSNRTLAIILGAGPGTGAALAMAFAKTHGAVALLARNEAKLAALVAEVEQDGGAAGSFSCDVTEAASVDEAFKSIKAKFPEHSVTAAIFNANSPLNPGPFLELKEDDLRPNVELNLYGAFRFSQAVLPLLLAAGGGFYGISGATASVKGSAKFAAFAPSKGALRLFSQSLAREFGPQGVHVAHVVIDGIIDTERTRGWVGEPKDADSRINAADLAQVFVSLSQQPKNCWTHEMDVRPAAESF
ncbi:hypothetical protein JCM9279_006070 [Rhodotorula babjevae]